VGKVTCSFMLGLIVGVLFMNGDAAAKWGLRFENFNFGTGINTINRDITFPEVPQYVHDNLKTSFLIDMRFDFRTKWNLRFSPGAQFWTWGEFPDQEEEGVQTSIKELDLNFDFHRFLLSYRRITPYVGLGMGWHFSFIETKFPSSLFKRSPIVVLEVIESLFDMGVNFIGGFDIKLNDHFTLFHEYRYEYSGTLNQLIILIGISTI